MNDTSLLKTRSSFSRKFNFHIKSFCDRYVNVLYHFVLMREYFMRASNNSEINLESSILSPSVHLKESDSIIDRRYDALPLRENLFKRYIV